MIPKGRFGKNRDGLLFFVFKFKDYDYRGGNECNGVSCDDCGIGVVNSMYYPGR